MIVPTAPHQFQSWQLKEMPAVDAVRPGLWSIPVPMPGNPMRYMYVYAFALPDGVALIDAGWPTEEAWVALVGGLASIGYTPHDVRGVMLTHGHSDHYGLSGRIRAMSGAWIAMHKADLPMVDAQNPAGAQDRQLSWILARGAGPDDVAATSSEPTTDSFFALEPPDRFLAEGDRPLAPDWDLTVVGTPGHTMGSLCYLLGGEHTVLFSGDHVLPHISPHVSSFSRELENLAENPLDAYLVSLQKVAQLDVHEVLPGHEYRFSGLRERVAEMLVHHVERLSEVEAILIGAGELSTWDVAARTTWSRGWEKTVGMSRRTALAETLSHLLSLQAAGKVISLPGAVDRWSAAHEGAVA